MELVQNLGVPHTEIDLILANGVSVGLDYPVCDGDLISVFPMFESLDISSVSRVRPNPLRRPRFVLDVHLGGLARKLRMLGLDAAYDPRAEDSDLATMAATEGRTLLTKDRELLKRRSVTHGYYVRAARPLEQAAEVVRRLDLVRMIEPLARCLCCNAELQRLQGRPRGVAEAVASGQKGFRRCPSCHRVYWRGTHWRAMLAEVQRILSAACPKGEGSEQCPTRSGQQEGLAGSSRS